MSKITVAWHKPVTKESGAEAWAAPDICLTPSALGPIPIPYVNIARSCDLKKGSKTVRIKGASVMLANSTLYPSSGNEAGRLGGVVSKTTRGKARAVTSSAIVRIEGQAVVRNGDITLQNNGNATGTIIQR